MRIHYEKNIREHLTKLHLNEISFGKFVELLNEDALKQLKLNAVEVAELGQVKVNGRSGANIMDAAKECIYIANLLKVAVELYWNGKRIDVYVDSRAEDIIKKAVNP